MTRERQPLNMFTSSHDSKRKQSEVDENNLIRTMERRSGIMSLCLEVCQQKVLAKHC